MATNSRPTTEFHVTYGALSTVSTERTLNPVLIAPRYKIHSYEDGYEESLIGSYKEGIVTYERADGTLANYTPASSEAIPWPGMTKDAILDTASSAVYAKQPFVQLNADGIAGTVDEFKRNAINVTKSLQLIDDDTEVEPKLNGFSVQVGDKVKIMQEGEDDLYVSITGLGATYSPSSVGSATALTGSSYTGIATDGSFSGSSDATYLVKVLETPAEGASTVRVQVIALTGDEGYVSSFNAGTSAVALGSKGATIAFSGEVDSCKAGDCWSVTCKASAISAYNVIYVNQELTNKAVVSLHFCANRYCEDYVKLNTGVAMNAAGLEVDTGVMISVKSIVNDITTSVACELVEADLYAVYREQITADALQIVSSNATGAAAWAGVADPRNPMGLLYAACSGVADGFFYMVATTSNDDAGYIQAINYAAQFETMYAFVTWSETPAVYAAKTAAVAKYSDPLIAQFKKTWYAPVVTNEDTVYAKASDDSVLLASIDAKGVVTLATPGNAITGGVAPGDYMVVYSTVDSQTGEWKSTRYKVTEITDADTLRVENGTITDLCRVEFVRVLSNADYAKKIAAMASSINDYRTNLVWCSGSINFGDFSDVNPAVVAAILATTRGALAPHAPLTGLGVSGITLTDKYKFTDVEYEVLNAGGVWVVANNSQGVAVNYHQITTKTDGTVAEEDSCVSAGDAVVREIRNSVAPLTAGSVNVSDQLVNDIETQLRATMAVIMGRAYPSSYGPLVEGYSIIELGSPESNNAAVMLKMDIDTPQPLLKGEVYCNII